MHSISEHAVIRKRVGGGILERKNEVNKHTNRCLLSHTRYTYADDVVGEAL